MCRKSRWQTRAALLAACLLFLQGCTGESSSVLDEDSSAAASASQTTQLREEITGPPSVRLAHIFADHMVLQRNKRVRIWGSCSGSAAVTVEFKGQIKTAEVIQGAWSVYLEAMDADAAGSTLTVKTDNASAAIADVLVGDVWLCSGQSNMEMTIGACNAEQKKKIKAAAGNGNVRLTKIPPAMSYTEEADFEAQAVWKDSAYAANIANSAYAFVFAARLAQELDVPVGIINGSYGGTDIEQWLSAAALDSINVRYGKPLTYNPMIAPLKGMALKGILWYQGENNVTRGTSYTMLFNAYAKQCRTEFQDEQLPIVTTMLDRYYDVNLLKWGPFRLEQWAIAQADPHVEIVCSIDMGDKTNIHPNDKYELGQRAAALTLNRIYGQTQLPGQSACASALTRSGDTVTIAFDNAESGLLLSAGKTVVSLVVTDDKAAAHPVEATIVDNQLQFSIAGVDSPLYVRYAYDMYPETINLFTRNGLPVAPFSLAIN